MLAGQKWRNLLSFGYVCLLLSWLLGFVFLLAKLFLNHQLFFYRQADQLHYQDFVNVYMSGSLVYSGNGHSIYDPATQLAWWNHFLAPIHIDKALYWQYPPFFFSLMTPLALFPIALAFLLWTALSLTVGLAAILLLLKARRCFSRLDVALFCLGVLASLPSWMTLRMGHLAYFMLGLFALFYWSWVTRRDLPGGVALAMCSIKPQYLIFLLLPTLAACRWKLIACALVAELILIILAWATVGFENVIGYPNVLFHVETSATVHGVNPEQMISLRACLSQILPQTVALPVSLVVCFACLIALFLAWRLAIRRQGQAIPWAMALTVTAGLLVSPHTHFYDCLLLALPAALTLPNLNIWQALEEPDAAFRTWCLTLLIYPLIGVFLFAAWEFIPGAIHQPLPTMIVNLILLISAILCFRSSLLNPATASQEIQSLSSC